jgi:protein-disulfide isomerase
MSPRLRKAVDENDHSAGPQDAPITLVEYGDFECPYCGRAYPILKEIQKSLGNQLRLVFRNFPISQSHPHAEHAAEAAEVAAAHQRFWEMHDLLFENQDALEDADLVEYAGRLGLDVTGFRGDLERGAYSKDVEEDFSTGIRSGVNGTPTFFVNGERFDGDWTDQDAFTQSLLSSR